MKFLKKTLTVVHNVGNNGDIHRRLKYCIENFKTPIKDMKI